MSHIYAHSFAADFDWDATLGFTAFKIKNSELVGGPLWERLVALQIKPRLDSFLRLTHEPRFKGWAWVRVLKVIPLAYPDSWGSGGMHTEDLRETTLMRAAKKGDLALVRKLLAEGAHVNAKNRWGKTALSLAQREGYMEIAEALKKAGAKQ